MEDSKSREFDLNRALVETKMRWEVIETRMKGVDDRLEKMDEWIKGNGHKGIMERLSILENYNIAIQTSAQRVERWQLVILSILLSGVLGGVAIFFVAWVKNIT